MSVTYHDSGEITISAGEREERCGEPTPKCVLVAGQTFMIDDGSLWRIVDVQHDSFVLEDLHGQRKNFRLF